MQKKFDELLYFLQLDFITPTDNEVEAKENKNNENNMVDDTNDEEPILQDNVTYNAKISLSPTYKLPDAEGKQVTLEEALSIFSFQPGALANVPKFYLEVENTGKKRFPNDAKIYSVKGNTRENRKITVSQSGIFRCPVPFNSGNDFESGLKSTIRLVTGNPLGNGSSCCCNEWNKSKKIKNTPPCNGQFEGACIYDGIRIPQGKGLKRIWLRMGSETVLGRLFGEPFELKFFYGLGNDGSTEEKETRKKLYGAVKEDKKETKEEHNNGEQKEETKNTNYSTTLIQKCKELPEKFNEKTYNKIMKPVFKALQEGEFDESKSDILEAGCQAGLGLRKTMLVPMTNYTLRARESRKSWTRVEEKLKLKGGERYFKSLSDYGAMQVVLSSQQDLNEAKQEVRDGLDGLSIPWFKSSNLYALYQGHLVEIQVLYESIARIYKYNSTHRNEIDAGTHVDLSHKKNKCTDGKTFEAWAKKKLLSCMGTNLYTEAAFMKKLVKVAKEQDKAYDSFV